MKSRLASEVSRQHDMGLMELARLRQGCYRFSGALFLYPDQERLANLVAAAGELQEGNESLAAFPFFGPWQRLLTTLQGLAEGDAAEVREEYMRLFLVNPQAPPYESFYMDPERRVAGWIAAQLAHEYTKRGLALSPSLQESPDHVAVELEFMAFLCSLEAQAWERKVLEESAQALEWQHAFLRRHLVRWFPAFVRQVVVADQEGLYAVAAEAAGALIHHDQDLIALLSDRLRDGESIA
jgi:anaerobic sulfite reductase subunit A